MSPSSVPRSRVSNRPTTCARSAMAAASAPRTVAAVAAREGTVAPPEVVVPVVVLAVLAATAVQRALEGPPEVTREARLEGAVQVALAVAVAAIAPPPATRPRSAVPSPHAPQLTRASWWDPTGSVSRRPAQAPARSSRSERHSCSSFSPRWVRSGRGRWSWRVRFLTPALSSNLLILRARRAGRGASV